MTDSVKRLEWEFKLDPSAVDSSEDVCKLIEFAKAAVEKKWKEEGDEYRKKLEEEKAVLCSDGYWRAELQELKQMENDIMLPLGNPEINNFPVGDAGQTIHTIFYQARKILQDGIDRAPILMIHGLGGTAVQFLHNYQELCKHRDVYGIDIPGFGLSSHNTCYEGDPYKESEKRMVDMIDRWRVDRNIKDMVMVGHSLGGYVAMVYAMHYREHVQQLVLIEPWGMLTMEESKDLKNNNCYYKENCLALRWAITLSSPFKLKPFTLVRWCGKTLASMFYSLLPSMSHYIDIYEEETTSYLVASYTLYDPNGSGEDWFGLLSGHTYIYPTTSLQSRLPQQSSYPPVTLMYGQSHKFEGKQVSFADEGHILRCEMEKMGHKVVVMEIPAAGHHPHAENTTRFHELLHEILNKCDKLS